MKYSVLMSVYAKEQADHLRQSIASMLEQTLPPDDFVVVCDGPLPEALDGVLEAFVGQMPDIFRLVRLEQNEGLGVSLQEGMGHCRNEFVARMDSDDVATPERCQKQFAFMMKNQLDLCSGTVAEFLGDIDSVIAYRKLPRSHQEVERYAHRRNPMNHPCVMFRRDAVLAAGGYRHMPYFEDYDLWVRMLQNGCKVGNLDEVLLWMRVNEDTYRRRGGWRYCGAIRRFWQQQWRTGFVSFWGYACNTLMRCTVSLLPNVVRGMLFRRALRQKGI